MSRGKRIRPLRTGVKRRQRERNFEAVVRFRYFFPWLHSYLYYIVNQCKSKWTRFLGWDDHCSIQQKSLLVKCIRLSKQFHYYYYFPGYYFRPPPPLIEKCFLDDVSDILLPCSCYQTTMRSGRECASRQCLPTGNKGREEREGTGSPIWRCRTFGGRQILPQHISFKVTHSSSR